MIIGETLHIIRAMKATGNRPGIIARWKDDVAAWAQMHRTDPDAAAVNAWLPLWQDRPFYRADELVQLWPALAIITGFTMRWPTVLKSAKRLEHELDFYDLPHRLVRGKKYYIVERVHYWRNAPLEKVEREISNG